MGFAYTNYVASKLAGSVTNAWAPVYDPIDWQCRIDLAPSVDACLARKPGARMGLLIGDSHAKAAFGTLYRAAERHGLLLTGSAGGGCAPFFDTKWFGRSAERIASCALQKEHSLANLQDRRIKLSFAVLVGLWRAYVKDIGDPSADRPAADQHAIFVEKLEETLNILRKKGAERFIVIGQIPLYPNRPPECIARADRSHTPRDAACSISRKSYLKETKVAHEWLKSALAKHSDVRFIDPVNVFCDRKRCRPFDKHAALYINGKHLSNAGAERIYEAFKSDFEWAFAAGSGQ